MTDTVYCLGCGASFPTDGLTSEDHGYPLNSGMCKACVQEGRRRPWQIIAENGRLREEVRTWQGIASRWRCCDAGLRAAPDPCPWHQWGVRSSDSAALTGFEDNQRISVQPDDR